MVFIYKHFLSDIHFVVDVQNEYSNICKIADDVPQGSVIFDILIIFDIYISDFKTRKDKSTALYTDDTAIITKGKLSNNL